MGAEITEERQGGIRWIRARGMRTEVFTQLGRRMRQPIHHVLDTLPVVRRLTAQVTTDAGRQHFRAVCDASYGAFPTEWAELVALAAGAEVPVETLAGLNLRGDLGDLSAAPTGCSDLCWSGHRALLAHNEDGSRHFQDLWVILTLDIEDDPVHTCFWYPGFLPANAFTYTETGLVWTVDNLPTPHPAIAPGRHFVARGLQRRATTARQARAYLMEQNSAGAFAYNVGDASGELFTVEVGANQRGIVETTATNPLTWHTNHGRYIPDAPARSSGTSVERGRILDGVARPSQDPDVEWMLQYLVAPPPKGVFASGDSVTLVTMVADLRERIIVLKPRDQDPIMVAG